MGEKCSKQTGSGRFVVPCPQLRSLCPLGAIALVWLRPRKTLFAKLNTRVKSLSAAPTVTFIRKQPISFMIITFRKLVDDGENYDD